VSARKNNIREYHAWSSARQRCNNKNGRDYKRYGARGIYMCDRWSTFDLFLEDMGPRPSTKHQLDRIDNDGPYSPENCRWAKAKIQARNKRNNVWIFFDGQKKSLPEWAEKINIPTEVLRHRIFIRNWIVERALTTPLIKRGGSYVVRDKSGRFI